MAAMMVVMVHLEGQLRRLGYTGPWPEWMTSGVDIFFVISGFVMWLTARRRHSGTASFYWQRLIRIVPLYWVLTSFVAGMMLVLPSVVQSGRFDLQHLTMSYLFLPSLDPVGGLIQPVLEPGWTLNYEMYFYALFGSLLLLPDRLLLAAVSGWLVASASLGAMGLTDNVFAQFYGSCIVLDFGFGLLLGAAFAKGLVLPSPLAWMAIVFGMLKLAMPGLVSGPHWLIIGLPALAIVAGAVALERRHGVPRLPSLLLLGDASYSLYLSHGIVLSACVQITKRLRLDQYHDVVPVFFVGAGTAALLVGLMIHVGVEKRLLRWLPSQPGPAFALVWAALRTVRPLAAWSGMAAKLPRWSAS